MKSSFNTPTRWATIRRLSGVCLTKRPIFGLIGTVSFRTVVYAVQVGLHGLMHAAKTTGNMEHLKYYVDSIQTMADYFDYKDWDKEQFGDPTLTPRAWGLPDLDACGTIGVSLIETYEMTGNPKLLPVIHAIGNAVMTHIPRFPDGTYFRVNTMWADDLYMSCPFLARLYRLTGDKTYEDQVHLQVEGFRKRLWIEKEQIFSHIYFPKEEQMSGIPWGRGNGWIAVTLTEILTLLPKDNPHWAEELQLFQRFMQGVLACQDPCGMWHQVLNRPDSYLGNFLYGHVPVKHRPWNQPWMAGCGNLPALH